MFHLSVAKEPTLSTGKNLGGVSFCHFGHHNSGTLYYCVGFEKEGKYSFLSTF